MPFTFKLLGHVTVYHLEFNSQLKPMKSSTEERITHYDE